MLFLCLDTPKDAADVYFSCVIFHFYFVSVIRQSTTLKNTDPRTGEIPESYFLMFVSEYENSCSAVFHF